MYLISFKSTHHAMMMEMKVKEKNLKALTIPTPRAISNSCGMSIKLMEEVELEKLVEIVEKEDLKILGIFKVGDNTLEMVYEGR
ncbi:MAG: DUF3343 domain-containing protein [Proteocatella sp.]|jgi:hypothetical protein|nr:DUF3343 domain-containing protein [Proteocatella sp.]NCB71031.1 DUF3343 domain-containing protein [Clostridia bacterium]MBP7908042.1 DUF3343 domain-containing protein [Proteocatella sp.]MBP8654058.1 DUF3343 domain-containing protein [Proteocatella sp.]MBP9659063.1 DUF3343 domain-containing protein [Proteocatella sp.]